jgi:predicted secreted protein
MTVIAHPPLQLQATAGQALVIELESTPSAGVMWQLPAAPQGCTLTEGDTAPAGPGVGGSARQRFVLTCGKPGAQQLQFELKRPWESEVRAVQPVSVKVR